MLLNSTRQHRMAAILLLWEAVIPTEAFGGSVPELREGPSGSLIAIGNPNPTLSFNLTSVHDWHGGDPFLDIMTFARPWIGHEPEKWGGMTTAELIEHSYLDENAWPKVIPDYLRAIGTVFAEGVAESRKGHYTLSYDGVGNIDVKGDVRIVSTSDGVIEFYTGGEIFWIDITETDPDGVGENIRNISIVKNQYLELHAAGAIFNPDWVSKIADAREIRFMPWMDINGSTAVRWDDRSQPEHARVGRAVPIEYIVHLANQIGTIPWLSIPHAADSDYIESIATYVRDNLDPDLQVKVEYSNEIWNWAFPQARWLFEQTHSDWGVENYFDYHAKKAVEVATIWENVFYGENASRLINVLGTQTRNIWYTQELLEADGWRSVEPENFTPLSDVFEELAVTTYFGHEWVSNIDLRKQLLWAINDDEVDAELFLFERLKEELSDGEANRRHLILQSELAKKYGLRLVAYEGGQHVHHLFGVREFSQEEIDVVTEFLIEFVRSPYMADLYEISWNNWKEIGDGPYMIFGDMVKPSKYGSWGIFETLGSVTKRGERLFNLAANTDPWWSNSDTGNVFQHGVTTIGSSASEILRGTTEEDYLVGLGGDDTFYASEGSDGLNGGAGYDKAIFSHSVDNYIIRRDRAGLRVTGPNGSDFLLNFEELRFGANDTFHVSDGSIIRADSRAPNHDSYFAKTYRNDVLNGEESVGILSVGVGSKAFAAPAGGDVLRGSFAKGIPFGYVDTD